MKYYFVVHNYTETNNIYHIHFRQLLDDSQRDVKCMTYTEKIRFVITNITVEPVLACYIIPSIFSGLATQNLNLEKACRVNLNYGDEICDALTIRQTANYTL